MVPSGRYPTSYLECLSLWDLKNIAFVESFGETHPVGWVEKLFSWFFFFHVLHLKQKKTDQTCWPDRRSSKVVQPLVPAFANGLCTQKSIRRRSQTCKKSVIPPPTLSLSSPSHKHELLAKRPSRHVYALSRCKHSQETFDAFSKMLETKRKKGN